MQSQIKIFSRSMVLVSILNTAFGQSYTLQCVPDQRPRLDTQTVGNIAALLVDTSTEAAPPLVHRARAATTAPVIAIIAEDDSDARVAILRAGADDVISRPFVNEVLVARLRAKLRRSAFEQQKWQMRQSISVRRTILERRQMHLSPIEQRLLTLLRERDGDVVPFTELQRELWDEQVKLGRLRYHIHQLRYRLASHGSAMRIEIARGDGYRLVH